jgi:hypothetical protein
VTDVWFTAPPDPPEGERWCLHCLMQAKDMLTDLHKDLIAELMRDGKPGHHWIAWDNKIRLQPAITVGMSSIPQLGLVDLCFSHLATVSVKPQGALRPGQIPPGLLRGQG